LAAFSFEIHSHSREHSACSIMGVEELLVRAHELGLFGVIVTDHHFQWPEGEVQAMADRLTGGRLVALSAFEVTTSDPVQGGHAGDLLVFGMADTDTLGIWTPYDEACARAREHDALIIAAHPFREGMGSGDRIFSMDIDGIEIYNQNHSRLDVMRAKTAVQRAGFLGLAGSDSHRTSQVGQFLTVLRRPARTMPEFMAEIRARRFSLLSNRPDIR
jgi:predicted metal-dependent phosphoesterase TrpH